MLSLGESGQAESAGPAFSFQFLPLAKFGNEWQEVKAQKPPGFSAVLQCHPAQHSDLWIDRALGTPPIMLAWTYSLATNPQNMANNTVKSGLALSLFPL